MKYKFTIRKEIFLFLLPLVLIFSILYSILSLVRHDNYGSFGYDLGINSQTVWRYSTFQWPITTIDPFPELPKLAAHIELVYAVLAPFYWLWNDPRMLLILEVLFITTAAIPIYLLARSKNIKLFVSLAIIISYLTFYGVQNALWFDVHSITLGAAMLTWFIYFLDSKKYIPATIFFLLAILSKENIALVTFVVSMVYFFLRKDKVSLIYMAISVLYLFFVYFIFFPHIMQVTYLYQNRSGLLSNLSPMSFFDSPEKREALLYSLLGFGFLPLASLFILPIIADFGTYFVLASDLKASHGIFMHYRVLLAPLLAIGTIYTIATFKRLNTIYVALYLVLCAFLVQYLLHLPLSYLVKGWFWQQPESVSTINRVISDLPSDASIVSQNNITPHISHRDKIYTLYPVTEQFTTKQVCGDTSCSWFRWHDNPQYLVVDTSDAWDARHLLVDRDVYLAGLVNLERVKVIQPMRKEGTTILYKVLKNPADFKQK